MHSIKILVLLFIEFISAFDRIHKTAIITGDKIKIIFIFNHLIEVKYTSNKIPT
jgi:hypothetical protein